MPRYSKKEARELSWYRGDLRYKLKPHQRLIEEAFRQSKSLLFYGDCSRRTGKTFWAALKCVEWALTCQNPLPRIFYASSTKTGLKKFAIPAFEMILADCPEELKPRWKVSELTYTFPHNGAEIQLIGLDVNPEAGRGNNADLYVFEEAGFIDKLDYLYSSVVTPMTATRPGARVIMISTPPSTPAHPLTTTFLPKALAEGSYILLTIDDNTMLSPAQKKVLLEECLTETERLREYYCRHVTDESLSLCPEWSPEHEVELSRPAYFKQLHRYVAMDLGTKVDLTAIGFGWYDRLTRVFYLEQEDSINGPAMTTIALRDMVRKHEKAIWEGLEPYRRVADNDNPLLLQDLGSLHGLHFVPTGKDELKAMVDQVRVMVKEGRIKVNPKTCPKTIGCLRYGVWDKHRKRFGRSAAYGHFDHFAMLMYLIRNIDLYGGDPIAEPGRTKQAAKDRKELEIALEDMSGIFEGTE